jgi:cytochrome c
MKRITATASVTALAMFASACSGSESTPAESAEPEVVEAAEEETPVEGAEPEATEETAEATDAAADGDMMATKDGVAFASLTGDAEKGRIVFAQCKSCHAVEEGVNKTGPSLAGIVGRTAGTIDGYNYSPANASSGITWTEEQLYVYLEDPQRVVPKTKMIYPGQRDAQKRADVIAYLKNPT